MAFLPRLWRWRRRERRKPAILEGRPALSPQKYVERHFADSPAHARIALALRRRLETLTGWDLGGLDPDVALGGLLDATQLADSLDAVERAMAVQLSSEGRSVAALTLTELLAKSALNNVLGPAAAHSTWGAETLRTRSFRGVVLEIERCEQRTGKPLSD